MNNTQVNVSKEVSSAVSLIRTAILQSQERAIKAVNHEQLALYYGIGRFISANTRSINWGKCVIKVSVISKKGTAWIERIGSPSSQEYAWPI